MIALANFDSLSATLLGWIAQSLILGTLAAIIAWVLSRTLMRHARPSLLAAFWLVVLLKFIWPVGPSFPFSLTQIASSTVASLSQTRNAATAPIPAAQPTESAPLGGFASVVMVVLDTSSLAVQAAPRALSEGRLGVWAAWGAVAYVAAVALLAAARVRSYVLFARRCGRIPLSDDLLRHRVAALCRRAGLRVIPTVRVDPTGRGAFVYGVIRPTLVLSPAFDEHELDAVVLHETAHLRRGDLLVRVLQCIASTLLFFWPVVAWVNRRIDLAREVACDEWALRHSRLSPADYARCLLRASVRQSRSWSAFAPAAMAANPSHVERRIDMIMNATNVRSRGRLLTLAAGGAVAAWGGFVLSGASAAIKAPAAPDGAAQPAVITARSCDGDGAPMLSRIPLLGTLFRSQHPTHDVMFHAVASGDGCAGPVAFQFTAPQTAESLASFAAAHPTSDANGDGTLTQAEHDAYFVALAMQAPRGVLAAYPHADRDSDGQLSADEAAELVTSGPPMPHLMAMPAGGHFVAAGADLGNGPTTARGIGMNVSVDVDESTDGTTTQRRVVVIRKADGQSDVQVSGDQITVSGQPIEIALAGASPADGDKDETREIELPDGRKAIVRTIVRTSTTDSADQDDPAPQPRVFVARRLDADDSPTTAECDVVMGAPGTWTARLPEPPSVWLLTNVDATPSAAEVASFVASAEQAPLRTFFRMHPQADADGDGVLTTAERDAFLEAQTQRIREHILRAFPDADANGDGTLSQQEMHEHLLSKARAGAPGAGGGAFFINTADGVPLSVEGDVKVIIKRIDNADQDR